MKTKLSLALVLLGMVAAVHFLAKNKNGQELAQELNISKNTVYNYFAGKTKLRFSFALGLLDTFSLFSIRDLLEKFCGESLLNKLLPSYNLIKSFNVVCSETLRYR